MSLAASLGFEPFGCSRCHLFAKAGTRCRPNPAVFFLVLCWVTGFAVLGNAHEALGQPDGTSGEPARVAVFKDDIPVSGAGASPDYLARLLDSRWFKTTFLNSGQMADARSLSREQYDVLVLPYGASFPVKAADNFRKFLREGGKFFSTGGYAFDNMLERTDRGWQPPAPPLPPESEHVLWRYQIPAEQLRGKGRLTYSGFLKAADVSGPGMAYFAVYQFAADGSIVQWIDFAKVTGTRDWQQFSHRFNVHSNTARVEFQAGLYRCSGTAWFDDVRLEDQEGRPILTSGFEEEFNPDAQETNHWWRSDGRFCVVQGETRHSGQRALQAKLNFRLVPPERLNTRHGQPADGLEVASTQLGVFDADYRLQRVVSARAAPQQSVIRRDLCITNRPLEGWAAAGVAGYDTARWIPLVNGYDRYGRLRGAVGAMLRHSAGTYASSSWSFFGVTNRNLFAEAEPGMGQAFVDVMRSLARDTYLTSLISEVGCYRQGENVKLLAEVFNGGRRDRRVRLTVSIYEGEPPGLDAEPTARPFVELAAAVTVPRGKAQPIALEWKPGTFHADFYYLLGHLWEGDEEIDRIESAFMVRSEKAIAQGPALTFRDNYLRLGRRPMFLFGTDDWSYIFSTRRETPLQWLRDMRARRDLGVQIYENLQFGIPAPNQREGLLRKVDGLVQLAQEYQQVYFAGLLIGYNVAASEAELAQQAAWCGDFARRYAQVPGLIYYLNGDLRCELSQAVTPRLNEFLRQRYGSDERLRTAWGEAAPAQPLGSIPAEDFSDRGRAWQDGQVSDLNRFRAALIRRWSEALIRSIREHDAKHPTSSEFYQLPHQGVDIPAAIDGLDLCNFGYFDKPGADITRFPAICKYNDQRARGKSVGPGEYGVKTHPAWGDGQDYGYHISRTPEQAASLFLAIAHYSLGLGASRIHNWCWKDSAHNVFPWGMVYPCDGVPKDIACVHRNQSLLFRHFAPVYRQPEIYVLTPDSHRMGGGKWQVIEGILKSIDLALATHVDNLGTLNEDGLAIPPSAEAMFYPLPFCPADETYTKVRDWVRAGGVLYLSGDISYDEFHRRTRTQRLEELCGVRFVMENYPNISVSATNPADQPCIKIELAPPATGADATPRVLRRAEDGSPLLIEKPLGRGTVIFTPDPIELHSVASRRDRDLALYRSVLARAGIRPITLRPDDPAVHAFRVPMQDGGQVYVLFNTTDGQPPRTVTLSDAHPSATISVAPQRPGLLWFDGGGTLRAVETQGECAFGGKTVLQDETGGIVTSLDRKDIPHSSALLLMPLRPGSICISTARQWHRATVLTGDIHDGTWRTYETAPAGKSEAGLVINVSLDQALSLLLVTESASASKWCGVIERAIKAPASLP
jgi:hypothetical protein